MTFQEPKIQRTLFPGVDNDLIQVINYHIHIDLGCPELEFGLIGTTSESEGVLRVKNGKIHRNVDPDDESGNL